MRLDGLQLPEELIWADEFDWSGIFASTKRTIAGKFIVQEVQAPSDAGRIITLTSDDAWAERTVLIALQEMSRDLGRQLFLEMNDGRTFLCRFRHWDIPVMSSEMVLPTAFPEDVTNYKLSLKLAVI